MGEEAVTGRLAPSPTGALHLGHALSFMAAWCGARRRGGRVILRLEDLDSTRATTEHAEAAMADLAWLKLDWDGEPVVQSTRIQALREASRQLLEQGNAYPCVCTRRDLRQAGEDAEGIGAPHTDGPPYPGTCRHRYRTLNEAESESGREAGIRFIAEDESIVFEDVVYGRVETNVAREVGDFLVLRRDKTPAYQLAVVLDDARDGVTEVVRGRDLLSSTARQILLARRLDIVPPRYAHLPLVCDASGRRLAKRHADRSLQELRSAGVRPEQIVRWVAHALRQEPHDDVLALSREFDFARVPKQDILLPEEGHAIF